MIPSVRDPLYRGLVIVLAAVLVSAAMHWPGPLHWTGAFWGGGGDAFQYPWNFFWIRHCVSTQNLDIYKTPFLFAPNGLSVHYHDLSLANCLLFLLLPGVRSELTAYNILMFLHTVVSLLGMYLLVRSNCRSRPAAFFGGTAFAFSAYRVMHMHGHLSLSATEWLPLFFWSLQRLLSPAPAEHRFAKTRSVLLTSCIFAGAFFSHPYYGFHLAIGTLVFVPSCLIDLKPIKIRSALASLSMVALISGLLTLPLLGPMLLHADDYSSYLQDNDTYLINYSADLISYVLPSPYHPLWGNAMSRIFFKDGGLRGGRYEGAVGLSLTLALLGFAGFFLKNTGWRWRFLSLTGLLLSLGPNPVINNVSYPFPLPYHWLKNVPLFSFNRVPCRFADLVLISFCVMGSTALSGWMQRSRHPKRIFIPIQGLLLFELLFAPMKIVKHPVPLTLQTLACMKDDRALFHVDYKGAILMYYQTFHHHRINGGFSARIADRDLSKQQELLERVALQYCLKQDDIIDRRAAMDYVWNDLGYGYLMVPKRWEMVTEPAGGPIEEQLKKLLTYPVLAEDEDYVIFVLPDRSDGGPVLEMNRGWNEPVEGIRGRKLSHENRLIVRNPENIPAGILLELEVLPPAGLKVLLDGNLVFHREYPGGLPSRTEQVRIDAGLVRDGSVLSICSEHNPDAASGSPAGIVLKNAGITDESGPH